MIQLVEKVKLSPARLLCLLQHALRGTTIALLARDKNKAAIFLNVIGNSIPRSGQTRPVRAGASRTGIERLPPCEIANAILLTASTPALISSRLFGFSVKALARSFQRDHCDICCLLDACSSRTGQRDEAIDAA